MKILFVNFTKFWGGGENWTYQFLAELKKRNHSVVLLSNFQSELHSKAEVNNVEIYAFKVNKTSFLDYRLKIKVEKILIEQKPDAIILNSALEMKTIGLAIQASGCTNVILMRGIPVPMKLNPLKRYLFLHVVSHVVVNSNYVKKSLANVLKYIKNEPTIIYHGIQPDSMVFSEGTTKNIAIVGRLSYEKGVDIALKVIQKVLDHQPDAKLWIIGDGKERNSLRKLTIGLGVEQSVEYFGFLDNVDELLSKCSILIMTSRWEGFGLVLLEAMKLKIPCVAFDHTAANEIIVDNKTGFLIPNMNVDLMSERLIYLLLNPEKARKMGENGNDLLYSTFTLEKSIDKYEELIVKSLKNGKKHSNTLLSFYKEPE
jgi:glycosyltransferase involved in cell wall biosynthesis